MSEKNQNIRLSVSMIVKNESSCLEKCLESVKGADEIVIVDTGSTDNTIEIAKRYTDKVFFGDEYLWRDDFSFSRNQSLERCTGDWVLIIDADETLEDGGIEKIRDVLPNIKMDCVYIRVVSKSGEANRGIRLFRTGKGIHWQEPAHNVLSENKGVNYDVTITYGYSAAHKLDPDRTLRILTKAVNKKITPRRLYYLAREFWYRRDYKTAAMWFEKYTKIGTWRPELADAWLYLARCYWQLQRGDEARDAVTMAVRVNPDFKEALLFMAETHYDPMKSHWLKYAQFATNKDVLFIRT